MDEFSDIWIEQCDAARDIREAWGTRKALGYLIGEKLLNHIRAADSDPSWAAKLPLFAAEIKRIFTSEELGAYFATTTRVGSIGHVATDEQIRRCATRARSMTMWSAELLTPSCLNERAGCCSMLQHAADLESAPSCSPGAFEVAPAT